MEFRDLKKQYTINKENIDKAIQEVIDSTHFIMGEKVVELEKILADFVGVKHCITCANGTDALQLALMAWDIGEGDAVFVPDFTFFSSGEVVSALGATPIFVDVREDTFNMDTKSLEKMIDKTISQTNLTPKVIIAVDLFGQPAEFDEIEKIAKIYSMYILEDGAQGFGGRIGNRRACSFGHIATTSFFPAKPLGCYGDGGAIFTDDDRWGELIKSYRVHGKGTSKYDNVRIGMNSRLDTLQAAILIEKLSVFENKELEMCNKVAGKYSSMLKDLVKTPIVLGGYCSSWAQYTIQMKNKEERDGLQVYLKEKGIPTAVYYQKPMHRQGAFDSDLYDDDDYIITNRLSETVISIPIYPYMCDEDINYVVEMINGFGKDTCKLGLDC